MLSDDEVVRANAYRSDAARSAFITGRILSRMALSKRYDCDPSSLKIVLGPNGRPEVDQLSGAHFNISHTRGLTICAVAECPVGVDVEFMDPNLDLDELGPICMSEPEARALLGKESGARLAYFLNIWTLKEAYLKAIGIGLNQSPNSLVVDFESNPLGIFDAQRIAGAPWCLQSLALGPSYIGALAVKTDATPEVRFHHFEEVGPGWADPCTAPT